jgi:hypothetical protein
MKQKFKAELVAHGPKGAWIFLAIPVAVTKAFGSKARLPVVGTINGFAFRSSILPEGDGTHSLAVNKQMQAGANARAGDTVNVAMELDRGERVVELPPELQQLLDRDVKAAQAFAGMSYSCRKEYADWIAEAKRTETKEARVKKAREMLTAGKKLR